MDSTQLKRGTDVYFVDKSEGPGVVIYIRGTVVDTSSSSVTLEVTDSGTLIAPGYSAPWEPSYAPGRMIEVEPDRYSSFLSISDFEALRNEYEGETEALEYPATETSVGDEEEKEQEDTREKIEEEAPDFDPADEGLYLQASLKSWGNSVGIEWPTGFPQEWMEEVYNALPEGSAERAPSGEPVIGIPGTKGPGVPPDLSQAVSFEEEFREASERLSKAVAAHEAAKEAAENAPEGSEEVAAFKKALKDLEAARDNFVEVKERAKVWSRPPDKTPYEQVPGRRQPYEISWGRAALRQELKQLSDNYKKTLGLVDSVRQFEKRTASTQRELDLLLALRKKKLEHTHEGDSGKLVRRLVGIPTPNILEALKKLKYRELKDKPYLWSREERDMLVPASDETSAVFQDKVGEPRTFFDLTPEEVDRFVARDAEEKGPMDPEEVAKRAWAYAVEYKDFIKQRMGRRDTVEEIKKFFRAEKDLIISDERAKHLEEEMYSPAHSVLVRGRDISTGKVTEIRLSTKDIYEGVIGKIVRSYEKRIKWLEFLQNNRKAELARQKAELKRSLVEKDEEGTSVKPIDEEKYKDAIISLFNKYAKVSHEEETPKKVPSKYKVHHGLPAYTEKYKELLSKRKEEAQLEGKLDSLRAELHKAFLPYQKADEDLQLLQDDIGRELSQEKAHKEALQLDRIALASREISEKIAELISEREYARKFYQDEEEKRDKVKELSDEIQRKTSALERSRTELFGPLPPKTLRKMMAYDRELKRTFSEYTAKVKEVEAQMEDLYNKLKEIRDEKAKIAEEIGR